MRERMNEPRRIRRLRIRDFVVTEENWIFAVVCYDTDPRYGGVKCILRYVPDAHGDRTVDERWKHYDYGVKRFRKLDFAAAYEFLREKRPEYLKDIFQVVPDNEISHVLRPSEVLPAFAERDERVRKIAEIFSTEIPVSKMGITGSFLCGLHTEKSDIDFVIYGIENFSKAREILMDATKKGEIQQINDDMWYYIYKKRKPSLPFKMFKAHECRKWNRGIVGNTYFDILFVRDYSEMGGLRRIYRKGKKLCNARIECIVKDAKFCFDSPAVYEVETYAADWIDMEGDWIDMERIKEENITEILSFTHTYAGQAFEGERVIAQGVVEQCDDGSLRLVVGTTREAKNEWIICTER